MVCVTNVNMVFVKSCNKWSLCCHNIIVYFLFISCLLVGATIDDVRNSKMPKVDKTIWDQSRITTNGQINLNRRFMNNLRVKNVHRRVRDTWRIPSKDQPKSTQFFTRRLSSDSSSTASLPSNPPYLRNEQGHSFKIASKRTAPMNKMLTVVKTYGPRAVQVVEPKDFYKNIYGTEAGLRSLKSYNAPANLTQAKIVHGVDQELEDVRLANEHFLRMRKIGRCHSPVAEIVCVKDYYPSDIKEYLPRCTLLHRCGDKSGCCDSDGFKCVAKFVQEVSLNFYTVLASSRASDANVASSVEKLLFENHTECECMVTESRTTDVVNLATSTTTTTVTTQTTSTPTTTTEAPMRTMDHSHDQKPQKDHHSIPGSSHNRKCRECPEPFYYREYPDGRCSCDCFDKHKPCLKVKRGREPLLDREQRCVETGRCHIPDCEFGKYDYPSGKCPKKPEHAQKGNRNDHSKNANHDNHRWIYYERD